MPKLDLGLPTNLSEVSFIFPTSCREVAFENSVQLGQNYFLPVDISLENVLTGKESFFTTVDFRSL